MKRVAAAFEASIAPNIAKAYWVALHRFAEWLDGRPVSDVTVAAYVAALKEDGKAPATIKQAVAATGAAAKAQGRDDPRGPRAKRAGAPCAETPARGGARWRDSAART